MKRRCCCASRAAMTWSRGAVSMSTHGESSVRRPGRSGVWKMRRAHNICIHVVPHFGGVEMTMSSSRNSNPSQRWLSATIEWYRRFAGRIPITPGSQSVRLSAMKVDLIDGTYELFRHHYGLPSAVREQGSRTAATRGVLTSVVAMLEGGATHVGVATDHVIESFRNEMWPGYKSSLGMPEDLLAQFPLLEEALAAAGITVWAMVEQEADDGLAAAAEVADGEA